MESLQSRPKWNNSQTSIPPCLRHFRSSGLGALGDNWNWIELVYSRVELESEWNRRDLVRNWNWIGIDFSLCLRQGYKWLHCKCMWKPKMKQSHQNEMREQLKCHPSSCRHPHPNHGNTSCNQGRGSGSHARAPITCTRIHVRVPLVSQSLHVYWKVEFQSFPTVYNTPICRSI